MHQLLDDETFLADPSIFPDRASQEEAIDGTLYPALRTWLRCREAGIPYSAGGMGEVMIEGASGPEQCMRWSCDMGRGFDLFSDRVKCFYYDGRVDEEHAVSYGPTIDYEEPNFLEQLTHVLSHAVSEGIKDGVVVCPDCGTVLPVRSSVAA